MLFSWPSETLLSQIAAHCQLGEVVCEPDHNNIVIGWLDGDFVISISAGGDAVGYGSGTAKG